MTREQAKVIQPIMQAYVEGKTIQRLMSEGFWEDYDNPTFYGDVKYRIKPESKYVPFESKEECWQEMHKHPDFGWVNYDDSICFIQSISPKGITITDWAETNSFFFDECLENNLTFTDGIPFGIMGLE